MYLADRYSERKEAAQEIQLRSWLDTPDFTPYPALMDALLDLTRSRGLRCPVFLDVIVSN